MRALKGIAILSAALGALWSCGQSWRPVTYLEGLRVLAVRAEPADLNPGGLTTLNALVVDPSAPARQNTLLWLACDPDPAALDQPLCAKFTTFSDPAELVGAGGSLPEGVRFVGLGEEGLYRAPAELFAPLPADSPHRRRGLVAVVLLIAIGAPPPESFPPTELELAELMEKVRTKQVASVLAIKRLRISEDPALNSNPEIAGIRFDGELWGPGLRPVKLRPGQDHEVIGEAAEGAAEHYLTLDADDQPAEGDERLIFSWFSTFGDFEAARSPAGEALQSFGVPWPFDELPADRRGAIHAVLRDGRGGASWIKRGFFVCDPNLAPPAIAAVEPAGAPPASTVSIRGTGLDRVIDVRLGAGWLADVRYDAAGGALTGIVPSDTPAGPALLTVRGEGCGQDPAVEYSVGQAQ